MDAIGARLPGGEQVVREIGRGALARVYLVSDGRSVRALKLLPEGDDGRARHEHDIACGLDHPHLNRTDAVVAVRGHPAILMPFVPGRRLVARSRAVRGRTAYLDAFDGLLAGLAELHRVGVVHRDVKPENVLVDATGVARLIDFDLAARRGERPVALVGTVAYLSPEQARGDAAVPASDVYAAGVMLYGALTGEVPFTGTVAEVVTAHRDAEIRAPSWFDPDLAPFDAFCARALAKRAGDRFPDGDHALDALRSLRRRAPASGGSRPGPRRMTG